jgi:hypothetical protein
VAFRNALERIPVAGPPVVWGAPRPATVLRSRQVPAPGASATLSPGGRAFLMADDDEDERTSGTIFRAGDFDGHLVTIGGTEAAFLDDQRLAVVRGSGHAGAELAVVSLAKGPDPIWTRPLPDLDAEEVQMQIEPGGRSILLVGVPRNDQDQRIALRVPAEPEAAIESLPLGHRLAVLDQRLGFVVTPQGEAESWVLRHPGPAPAPDQIASAYVAAGQRAEIEHDLVLWLLTPQAEVLVAGGVPHLACLAPTLTRGSIWCQAVSDRRFLFKIDAAARRMTRVNGDLPAAWRTELVSPSKMAMLWNGDLGVLDLETGQGVWLTLPDAPDQGFAALVEGGLATFSRSGRSKHATITVYAIP